MMHLAAYGLAFDNVWRCRSQSQAVCILGHEGLLAWNSGNHRDFHKDLWWVMMVQAYLDLFGSNMFKQYRYRPPLTFRNGKNTLSFLLFYNDVTAVWRGIEWVKLGCGIREWTRMVWWAANTMLLAHRRVSNESRHVKRLWLLLREAFAHWFSS